MAQILGINLVLYWNDKN